MDSRSVFVVHGRNIATRDAIFTFLRSLDLSPIEWEQAGDLTGKSTPITLESIQAAMRTSQAVIILLTADDEARLRPEYGQEQVKYQPRPNVFFEGGLAIGILGEERVLLVRSGATRAVSDLDGLNYLDLKDSPEARQALAHRLKRAGCPINTTGSSYLTQSSGGDFEATSLLDEVAGPVVLSRGGFDDHVVDATLSYTINNVNMLKDLESQLINPGQADLKYCYLGLSGATNWLNLSEDQKYAPTDSKETQSKSLVQLFNHEKIVGQVVDIISLGPGDGKVDATILREISKVCSVVNYYPLDVSIELLQKTIENTHGSCRRHRIKIKAILGDFLNLRAYKPIYGYDDATNIFILAGFTFGNYSEGNLLGRIRDGLNTGDFLVLDARLHAEGNRFNIKTLHARSTEILIGFSHLLNNRFAFGPVEMATTTDFSSSDVSQELSVNYTTVPSAFNIVTFCKELKTRLRSNGRSVSHHRLDLAVTTLYNEDELIRWIEERGFRLVDKSRTDNAITLLLQKR